MKITINEVTINENEFEAAVKITGMLNRFNDNSTYEFQRVVESEIARILSEKIILERGPEILNAVTNNQIINAVIMRVAGSIGNKER